MTTGQSKAALRPDAVGADWSQLPMGHLTFIVVAWVCVGAVVSTAWSKYVNGRWWSGTLLGFIVQIVIWPVIAGVLVIDVARHRP